MFYNMLAWYLFISIIHIQVILLGGMLFTRGVYADKGQVFYDFMYGKLWKFNIFIIVKEIIVMLLTFITYKKLSFYGNKKEDIKLEDLTRWGVRPEDVVLDEEGNILEWESFKNKIKVLTKRPH